MPKSNPTGRYVSPDEFLPSPHRGSFKAPRVEDVAYYLHEPPADGGRAETVRFGRGFLAALPWALLFWAGVAAVILTIWWAATR